MTVPESTMRDVPVLYLEHGMILDENCAIHLGKLMNKGHGIVFDYLIDLSGSLSLDHASLLIVLLDRTDVQVKVEMLFLFLEKLNSTSYLRKPSKWQARSLVRLAGIEPIQGVRKIPRRLWPFCPNYQTLDDQKYQHIMSRFSYLPFSDMKLSATKTIRTSTDGVSFLSLTKYKWLYAVLIKRGLIKIFQQFLSRACSLTLFFISWLHKKR